MLAFRHWARWGYLISPMLIVIQSLASQAKLATEILYANWTCEKPRHVHFHFKGSLETFAKLTFL